MVARRRPSLASLRVARNWTLLGLVACGLIAFGVFFLLVARYRVARV